MNKPLDYEHNEVEGSIVLNKPLDYEHNEMEVRHMNTRKRYKEIKKSSDLGLIIGGVVVVIILVILYFIFFHN